MSIDEIVQAWKDNEHLDGVPLVESPAGEELSDQDLQEVVGGMECVGVSCFFCASYLIMTYTM